MLRMDSLRISRAYRRKRLSLKEPVIIILLAAWLLVSISWLFKLIITNSEADVENSKTRVRLTLQQTPITVVSAICGASKANGSLNMMPTTSKQVEQLEVMIKSLVLNERNYLRTLFPRHDYTDLSDDDFGLGEWKSVELIIFTDDKKHFDQIESYLHTSGNINSAFLKPLKLVYAPLTIPEEYQHLEKHLTPCGTLRLFLGKLLPNHETAIYMDSDVIFMKPVADLYEDFANFTSAQWCGMGSDWSHGRLSYGGSFGMNFGVGIYNLTRMRLSNFPSFLTDALQKYVKRGRFGGASTTLDQKILRQYFYSHNQELNQLTCDRNYMPGHCRFDNLCRPAELNNGITLLHGSSPVFNSQQFESNFLETFKFYKTLNMKSLVPKEFAYAQLRMRLRENKEKYKRIAKEESLPAAIRHRKEYCIENIDFADEIMGKFYV